VQCKFLEVHGFLDHPNVFVLTVTCSGVVVIDDQPEVSIDDPSFLFESNEGFQEVTSRRTQKSKQKAALEEALKRTQAAAQAKRLDKEGKVWLEHQTVLYWTNALEI